tara:strand:+ start:5372 stop:7096 length:1725 start_codon:yes stop_codon:yes gene_type:complete
MAKQLKLRRGTTSQHGSFTGAEGEVTVDTDKETLVVHDGSTAGGHPVAAEDMANVSSASIAGRLSNDSIATSKIAAGALPSDVTVANANVTSSAAIAGTKIDPDFGSQQISTTGTIGSGDITLTNTQPKVVFNDSNNNSDYQIENLNGVFKIRDNTNSADRVTIDSSGDTIVTGNLNASSGVDVTGNITCTGTVDGRDLQTDGTKLDGIETAATADQTASEIRTLVESASDSNVFTDADHSKLNGIESGATGDQSNAEIRSAVAAASDSNVFTDADHAKLDALTTSNGVILNGVTATTQSASDNSTKVATTAYTDTAISNLVDSSPGALNTLNELAAAINDDASFSTTVTNSIATKMPLAGGEFTGDVTSHNITPDGDSSRNLGTNSVRFANVYADNFVGGGGNLTGVESFVSGMIILWSGAVNAIPSGFVLCNGSNSTPDLRDRFVVGAGNTYSVGATGGALVSTDNVSVSGSDTVSISASGTASITVSGTTGNDNEISTFSGRQPGNSQHLGVQFVPNYQYFTNSSHTHSFSGSGSDTVSVSGTDTVNITGTDTVSVSTLSPYYALCYIMKT